MVFILLIMLYGSECWAINNVDLQRIDALDQWCLRRTFTFVGMTIQPPLSFIVKSRRLSFIKYLMRMNENADTSQVILSLLLRAGDVRLGGHVLPGWRPSKVISLLWIWSCMKSENWLRIDLSGDWCLCIVLRTRSGACFYWTGYLPDRTVCLSTIKLLSK